MTKVLIALISSEVQMFILQLDQQPKQLVQRKGSYEAVK